MLKFPLHKRCIAARRHRRNGRLFPKSRDKAQPLQVRSRHAHSLPPYRNNWSPHVRFDLRRRRDGARDPILGLNEAFASDTAPRRSTSASASIRRQRQDPAARRRRGPKARLEAMPPRATSRSRPAALTTPCRACSSARTPQLATSGRVVTVEALGGTGALKVGADYLKRLSPRHQGLDLRPELGEPPRAVRIRRLSGRELPYYDAASPRRELRRHEGQARQPAARLGHRAARLLPQPTGADLSDAQWDEVVAIAARGLIPFLDMAYQGFAEGIDADAVGHCALFGQRPAVLRVELVLQELLALRRARRRAVHRHRQQGRRKPRVLSQVKRVIRTNYSTRRSTAAPSSPPC